MKLIFMTCAQSSAVDSQTGRLSLFHLLEQIQAPSFPTAMPLTLVGLFVKEPGEPDEQSVRLKVELGDAVIFDSPVAFSFKGRQRSRVLTVMNGLGIPGVGTLSFSFLSEAGAPLGPAWTVIVEQAAAPPAAPLPAA